MTHPFAKLREQEPCGPIMRKRPLVNGLMLFVLVAGISYGVGTLIVEGW